MTFSEIRALHNRPLLLRNVVQTVTAWDQRRRTRKDLRNLSDHMLRDIGLDPIIAAIEAAKPFWVA